MSEQTVERLDFTGPPPGFKIDTRGWTVVATGRRGWLGFHATGLTPLTYAWSTYKAENDPPGMRSRGAQVFVGARLVATQNGWTRAQARGAAWAWYERRLALVTRPDFGQVFLEGAQGPFWPRCLTWPDEQVASVEEVLRG